jgi:hypothetical protein
LIYEIQELKNASETERCVRRWGWLGTVLASRKRGHAPKLNRSAAYRLNHIVSKW